MTHPSTITQRFLSRSNQLGVVAVGFNGGQVGMPVTVQLLQLHVTPKEKNTAY